MAREKILLKNEIQYLSITISIVSVKLITSNLLRVSEFPPPNIKSHIRAFNIDTGKLEQVNGAIL